MKKAFGGPFWKSRNSKTDCRIRFGCGSFLMEIIFLWDFTEKLHRFYKCLQTLHKLNNNDDLSHIKLEKKVKDNGLCKKFSARLTEEECRRILAGDTEWMMDHPKALVQELYVKMKSGPLRPKVLVSYVREPYVYAPGNVRVTFDSQLRTGGLHRKFLEPSVQDISATDTPDTMLMEVKYDDYLPEIIGKLVQTKGSRVQAFSKYRVCRRFG